MTLFVAGLGYGVGDGGNGPFSTVLLEPNVHDVMSMELAHHDMGGTVFDIIIAVSSVPLCYLCAVQDIWIREVSVEERWFSTTTTVCSNVLTL